MASAGAAGRARRQARHADPQRVPGGRGNRRRRDLRWFHGGAPRAGRRLGLRHPDTRGRGSLDPPHRKRRGRPLGRPGGSMVRPLFLVVLALLCSSTAYAERMGYPPGEFAARREKLAAAAAARRCIVMFGATEATPGAALPPGQRLLLSHRQRVAERRARDRRGHQGVAPLSAQADAAQIRYEGGNWLDEPDAAKAHAFTSIQPITALGEFLGRRRGVSGQETFWTRLSERDDVGGGRIDAAIEAGRRLVNPFAFAAQPGRAADCGVAAAVSLLRVPGRHAAHRSAAADQDAARDRDPALQRPHQRRGDEARHPGHRAPASTSTSSRPRPPTGT